MDILSLSVIAVLVTLLATVSLYAFWRRGDSKHPSPVIVVEGVKAIGELAVLRMIIKDYRESTPHACLSP